VYGGLKSPPNLFYILIKDVTENEQSRTASNVGIFAEVTTVGIEHGIQK
jgi:hypothetical protein